MGVDEQEGMLVDFVSRVRGHPWLRDSWIIYFCENNGVGASQAYRHSALLSQQFERVYCVRDIIKGVKKYGVHTSEERKIEYATEIRMQLNMGTLYFMRDFICNSSTGGKECDPARWVINELAAEMKRARIIPSKGAANHVTVSPRFQWTAKCREDGTINKDLSDDVLLALCMALHFSTCFLGHALGAVEYEKFD